MRSAALCLLLMVLAAPAARAEVAIAVSIPDENAVHRDFAAGIVTEASGRYAMQEPSLAPAIVTSCSGDEQCIVKQAHAAGASHVLIIGVAAIGPAEFVVSLRVFDVSNGAVLAGVSDVAAPGRDPREAGRAFAAQALASVKGVPPRVEKPESATAAATAPVDPRYSGVSPLSIAGWSVVGLGTAGAVGGTVLGLVLQSESPADNRVPMAVVGGAVTATLGLGLGLVLLDQLLAKPGT